MENKLYLNIYDFGVEIEVDSEQLYLKLSYDFEYFIVKRKPNTIKTLSIKVKQVDTLKVSEGLVATKQTENSIYYDVGNLRFNDYYGKVLTTFDYKKEQADIEYISIDKVYEVIYLLVLSRSGKYGDYIGRHKIHASAVSHNNKNLIFMMPSKGGKSTMLLELLRDESISLISDDTPLVTTSGEVKPFPLRIGHEDENKLYSYFPYLKRDDLYVFDRERFSKKYLIPISKLKNRIEVGDHSILVSGRRTTMKKPKLVKINKFTMLKELKTHMIVGIGLPMIIEYFLQHTIKDHITNFMILLKRITSSVFLVLKSDCYLVYLSNNTLENSKLLKELISER